MTPEELTQELLELKLGWRAEEEAGGKETSEGAKEELPRKSAVKAFVAAFAEFNKLLKHLERFC